MIVNLLKKNIVMIPVIASLLVGTFTGVRYVVNLTDSINSSEQEIINLQRDLKQVQKNIVCINFLPSAKLLQQKTVLYLFLQYFFEPV